MRRMGEELKWRAAEVAVLAAGRVKVGITEEKEKTRSLVGGVVEEWKRGAAKRPPLYCRKRVS